MSIRIEISGREFGVSGAGLYYKGRRRSFFLSFKRWPLREDFNLLAETDR